MRPIAAVCAVLAVVLAASAAAPVATPPPSAARLPALAADLSMKLSDAKVRAPGGGGEVRVAEVLDAGRIEKALATIGDAEAWPATWLIVQDLGRSWDLVLRVSLGADGNVEKPATLFAATRREWDHESFEAAYRELVGSKPPRERGRNLVVQSFSKRTVTTFVYQLPPTGAKAKGLMALLPEGSMLRESQAIRSSDGRLLTLAIVLVRPRFVPASCDGAAGARRDHADTGEVIAYLASESAIEASLDLTERFRDGAGSDPLVPRYACASGDEDPAVAALDPPKRFADRPLVRLMDISQTEDGSEQTLVRVAACDAGRGRREAAHLRVLSREGAGFSLTAD